MFRESGDPRPTYNQNMYPRMCTHCARHLKTYHSSDTCWWDETTARRYIWSHPSHYLVDPYTWPWSPNGHGHEWPTPTPFVQCQSALPFWDTAIHGQGHVCVQRSRSHVSNMILKIQRSWSWSNPLVTFEALSSIDIHCICLLFRGNRTTFGRHPPNSIFDLENSRSRSWRKSTKM